MAVVNCLVAKARRDVVQALREARWQHSGLRNRRIASGLPRSKLFRRAIPLPYLLPEKVLTGFKLPGYVKDKRKVTFGSLIPTDAPKAVASPLVCPDRSEQVRFCRSAIARPARSTSCNLAEKRKMLIRPAGEAVCSAGFRLNINAGQLTENIVITKLNKSVESE